MAELEALAEIRATSGGHSVVPGQYTWRYPLPEDKAIRLGSDPARSEWVVPEDRMISRFHATLEWDGAKLTVTRRPVTAEFPRPPQNHIWFRNNPAERCEVRAGEWFVIGQTRFTVRGDADAPLSPVDATAVHRQAEFTRAELESLTFSDPATFLKAMEQLPTFLRLVANEPGLFRQMLKVALAGVPRADAAAVVRVVPDPAGGEARVAVVEQNVRPPAAAGGEVFAPSGRLVRKAVRERKSCLHVWSTNPEDLDRNAATDHTMTLGAMYQSGDTPWAVCTPFQDGSPFALYVTGRVRADSAGGNRPDARMLTDCQKFAEILVGLMETTRRTLKLARQNAVLRDLLPNNVRKYLDDPDRFETLIRPQEKETTILFCDLRNYSGYAEERGTRLFDAWKEIAACALEPMSATITDNGGIVAGFRGDAVLGFWGWPDAHPDQAVRAAQAALRIHERLHGRTSQRRCGLGLTHGPALAGRMGALDLAVLDLYGPVVNLAFRLEEMTKAFGVGIVISDALAEKLGAADPNGDRWRLRLLGRVRPKGMRPANAFELAPAVGGASWVSGEWFHAQIAAWNQAVRLFTDGKWADARDVLANFKENGDSAAECLVAHIDRARGKPPADWDGSFTPRPPTE